MLQSPSWLSVAAVLLPYLTSANPLPSPELHLESILKRDPSGPRLDDFPDPSLLKVGNTWYSFATEGQGVHYQVATSTDFNTWTKLAYSNGSPLDALPNLPPWVTASSDPATWAPDVHQLADGSFAMTYSASLASSPAHHCVGVAKATSPEGPYTPVGDNPLICPLSAGGAIDSSYFRDSNNQLYLLWKVDGNSIGSGGPCNQNPNPPYVPTPIQIQPINEDGVTLSGSATSIFDATQEDAGIVEAPSLTKIGNYYYLFYSHGCYTSSLYSVSYAYSTNLLGPYTRGSRPLFQTGDYGLSGPGGATAFQDGQRLVFHGNNDGGRSLYTAIISANAGTVTA